MNQQSASLPQQFNFARHILDLNQGRASKTA